MKIDWHDYGARYYDPALGRFHTQDRFAEKYFPLTPYQYGANNPIRFIDINGDSIFWDSKGRETRELQRQIKTLRKNSETFNTLFSFFEGSEDYHINIGVGDEEVDESLADSEMTSQHREKVEGISSDGGRKILYRNEVSDNALSEEFFHSFQRQVAYAPGERRSTELESEAKLFNYTVKQESSPGSYNWGAQLDNYFVSLHGNYVKSSTDYNIYRAYLNAFTPYYRSIPNHPYATPKVRTLAAPTAYNFLIYLRNNEK